MHSIPHHLKLILFEKNEDEALSPEEQEIWEEFIASEQSQPIRIHPDEMVFREALELYLRLKDEQIATWEKFEEQVLQHEEHVPAMQIEQRTRNRWVILWWVAIAALVLILLYRGCVV